MSRAVISRRLFLAGGISLRGAASTPQSETVYDFATADCEVRMSVVFHDRYSAGRFNGSLAIVRYRFRQVAGPASTGTLREHVRTIDQDVRLNDRPPFDRSIELEEGMACDIQAFGYETVPPASSPSARLAEAGGPWYYFRQDLYLAERSTPFLVLHWRHAFGAIRILDVIPGDGTSPVKRGTL